MAFQDAKTAGAREGILSGTTTDADLRVLGCRVDAVDANAAATRIAALIRQGRPAHVVTLGAEMAVLAARDERYRDAINAADLVVPDTIGVVVASRVLGRRCPERVAGIDLAQTLIAQCARDGVPVFFLGGAAGVAEQAAQTMLASNPGLIIAGTHHGYFVADEELDVAAQILDSRARLVVVGMGFPGQEYWIRRNLDRIGPAVCMGVGGAFDIWSGRLPRAPEGMRRAGMEWFYRLLHEPHRIRRQMALPRFAAQVAAQFVRQRLGRDRAGRN